TKDHVPPTCMFLSPIPNDVQMITVPCCEECRNEQQGDDAVARNFLVSSLAAESRGLPEDECEKKRNRSLERDRTLFKQMNSAITSADVFLEGNVFLGTAPALNLDQPAMDKFFARLTRALHYKETRSGHVSCTIKWKPVYDLRISSGFL